LSTENSEDKKQRIIEAGAALIHDRGYYHTGLKDILEAASIPKGSFYYFFKSKEDFGLHVVEYFSGFFSGVAEGCLRSENEKALGKLEDHFIFFEQYFLKSDFTGGCPIGNLAQELAAHSKEFGDRLEIVFERMTGSILEFLKEAAGKGEIPASNASQGMADFLIDSWEGTLLRVKTGRSIAPLEKWRLFICRNFLLRDQNL
jgi:TetR/AcrR family transcriptional repressor of nem operon